MAPSAANEREGPPEPLVALINSLISNNMLQWRLRTGAYICKCEPDDGRRHSAGTPEILFTLEQRSAIDQWSFGDLFLMMADKQADNSFSHSLCLILEAMLYSICEFLPGVRRAVFILISI